MEHHLTDRDLYRFTFDGPVLIREGVVRTYIRRYNYRNTFRSSELTANYSFNVSRLEASVLAGMSQEYNKYDQDYFIKYDLVDPSLERLTPEQQTAASPETTTNGPCAHTSAA